MDRRTKTPAEIQEEEDNLLIERFDGLWDKVARVGMMDFGNEFKQGLAWRMHPALYARVFTSENLYRRLVGYDLYQTVVEGKPLGAPGVMGIRIERDRSMPETEIVLRWEAKSDG